MNTSSAVPTARILTWNVERKHPVRSPVGSAAVEYVFAKEPDVLVLTEASADLPPRDGHVLASPPSPEDFYRADERKVALWSRHPWTDTGTASDALLADRVVWGTTDTPVGPLRVLGVCMPWHLAGTRYAEPLRTPWEVHLEFLDALAAMLRDQPPFDVIAGDYNQLRPRERGSRPAQKRIERTLAGCAIVTDGPLEGCERTAGVDHIAIASHLQRIEAFGWPAKVDEQRFSDHEGAGVVVARHSGEAQEAR